MKLWNEEATSTMMWYQAPLWAWSLDLMLLVCVRSVSGQDCAEPPVISHGYLPSGLQPTGPPYKNGSKLFYVCYSAYQLHGAPDSLACIDGSWIGVLPFCLELECSDPSTYPDTPVKTRVVSTGPYVNGSWAVFECVDYEYKFDRDCKNYQCWLGGWRWIGLERCTCILMECASPPAIDNGYFVAKSRYQHGDIVQYSCNTGFTLRPNTGPLTCSLEQWVGNFPVCDTQYCPRPSTIGSGYVKTYGPYTHGSFAGYSCNAGYTMNGQPYIKCQAGIWIGTAPTCHIINTTTVTVGGFPFWVLVTVLSVLLLLVLFSLTYLCCVCCCYNRCRCCRRKYVRPHTHPQENAPDTVKIIKK